VVDEEEFFSQGDSDYANNTEIVSIDLTRVLKQNRDEMMTIYAKLIANPYLASKLVPDFKSNIMNTAATLLEHGVPLDEAGKIRTPEDVVKEGVMELGGMLGGKIFGAGLKAKRAFQDSLRKAAKDYDEDVEIYRDPNDGSYYFIDPETGEEVDCDMEGNPLE
tara:strand:- start:4485 stop:4973 length:489 start_codon:yes stop_codon:yes gene_type:complete